MNRTHIVILGAGYAGIRTAKKLIRTMDSDARVTIIDRKNYHTLMTNLHEAASGRVHPNTIMIPLSNIFADQKIEVIQDEVHFIDFKEHRLRGEKGNYSFDYLVVATGSTVNYGKVEGANRYALSLDSIESAWTINHRLTRSKTGQVVICGGGLTAVEMAGELRSLHPEKEVTLIQGVDTLVPDIDLEIAWSIQDRLEKIGVRILTNTRVTEVREDKVICQDQDVTVTIDSDLTLWTGGILSGLLTEGPLPTAITDEFLRLKQYPFVYIAGDTGMVGPATVENSHQQADVIVKNIKHDLAGEAPESFQGTSRGMMISVGPKYGFTNTRIPLKGWPAALLKFIVDFFYVLSIAGPLQGGRYFMGNLVHVQHKQTLVGGLLSTRGQRLWLYPLRMYLGVLWFTEGYKKIIGSTNFNYARRFSDYFQIGEDSWLRAGNLMIPFEWLNSDAVSSATQAGTEAPLLENLPYWYEGLMRTIMPNPTIAMFFQGLMVFTELTIGIGLLLGLFTWLSSGISFLLAVNLVLAGAGGWEMSWIIPASLALMAGAGQFLGLDQFVMPYIRRNSLLE